MDAGRTVTAVVSIVVLTLMVTIVHQFVYGAMDVRGEPTRWQQWNGYKAGAAFTAVNDAEENGKTAEDYVQKKKRVVNSVRTSEPDNYFCSNDLPGFTEGDRINIVTYKPGEDCAGQFIGLNLTFYSKDHISSLRMDTMPQRFRGRTTVDVK